MGRWHKIFLFFVMTVVTVARSQEFPMQHFLMEDGLPSNKVYTTYRDSRGFMWIATDKGIARYNGIKFEIFTTFNGLPDNEVFFFQEDFDHRLWMATYNGALCYFKDDTFHTPANTSFLKLPFKASFVRRIELEKDSSVTVVFWKNPRFINIQGQQIHVIDLSQSPLRDSVELILERQKLEPGKYRFITRGNIVEADSVGNILSRSRLPVPDLDQMAPQYWGVSFTQNQSFIFSERYLFSREGQVVRSLDDTFLKKNVLFIVYRNSLSYFFATNNGILLNNNLRILQGYQVSSINQDKQGNYWATTLESGVFVLDKYFMNTRIFKDVYKGKVQYSFACGQVYFTAKDNNLYEISGARVTPVFNFGAYITEEARLLNTHIPLVDSNYRFFYIEDKSILTIDNLQRPYKTTRRLRLDLAQTNAFNSAIAVGDELYINANNRILHVNMVKKSPGGALKPEIASDEQNSEKIFGFAKAPDNAIWYSTPTNVFKVVDGRAAPQPQFRNTVFSYFGFYGSYLVGYTASNDLYICSNYNHVPVCTSVANENCIWDKFYKLGEDHVLIGTNNYYRLLNLSSQKVTIMDNLLIPLHAEAVCSDGSNVYFFKNGSVTAVELSRLITPPEAPRLYFTYLTTGNKTYRVQGQVQIPFKESKNVRISFATLSFGGRNLIYAYSVSKDEDNWQPTNGEDITLVNPSPGYYTVKVKARTVSSSFSPPIVFTLYVAQPFWTTWWFITICVWAFIAIIWGGMRYRLLLILRKREKAYETEIKFMKSEYKAMNALMNPHFIFNTLNNVQSLVNGNDKVAANEYLRIFADLIRQNMHNISRELIPLQKEVDLVANYLSLEKLRFEDQLTYAINVDEDLDLSEVMVPPLLIQPLVENSIKHGILPLRNKKGIIKLEIYEKENALYIEVRDNGVGMGEKKKDPLHESYGLGNIRQRIEQLGIMQHKKISFSIDEQMIKPDLQSWTVATIVIPFS